MNENKIVPNILYKKDSLAEFLKKYPEEADWADNKFAVKSNLFKLDGSVYLKGHPFYKGSKEVYTYSEIFCNFEISKINFPSHIRDADQAVDFMVDWTLQIVILEEFNNILEEFIYKKYGIKKEETPLTISLFYENCLWELPGQFRVNDRIAELGVEAAVLQALFLKLHKKFYDNDKELQKYFSIFPLFGIFTHLTDGTEENTWGEDPVIYCTKVPRTKYLPFGTSLSYKKIEKYLTDEQYNKWPF